MQLRELVRADASASEIYDHIRALPDDDRVQQVLALRGRLQSKLYTLVEGARSTSWSELIPDTDCTAKFEGRNSLPIFTRFQKRFFRTETGQYAGYNHSPGIVTFFAGPGYFVPRDSEGEVLCDYLQLPDIEPSDWPKKIPNRGRLRSIVFGNMVDYCRLVGPHTVVGKAFKYGKPLPQYFVLTRAAS